MRLSRIVPLLSVSAFSLPAMADTITLDGTLRDFKATTESGGHPDFERSICGVVYGMVESTLGSDGNPVRQASASCLSSRFNEWYTDTSGVNLSMAYSITLTETSPGVYTYANSSFFPLDGKLFGNYGGYGHNYHFTYEVHSTFGYSGGEVFNFTGDDDLWVFINGRLAVDIGGIHGATSKTISLDAMASTLGITPGHNYTFDVFFAERHTTASNFNITTSIVFSSEVCDDGRDNDGDGAIDSIDDDCWICGNGVVDPNEDCDPLYDPFCTASCGPAVEDCNDGADNDGDGLADGADPECCAEGDADFDGVCGEVDNCSEDANPDQADADGDGLGDVCDLCPLDALNDIDGDGVCGGDDLCPEAFDPEQYDVDGDGDGDACDVCPDDPENDADGDLVCEIVDNCDIVSNGDQADSDGDLYGDACDPCPVDAANDADGDLVCEVTDNCDLVSNGDQADGDGDLYGDACDPCPVDAANDFDSDLVCEVTDNCDLVSNPSQANGDGDALGDACDPCPVDAANDFDSDGVCEVTDNCDLASNPGQEDSDGDGPGDACDTCPFDADDDIDGDGVCGDVDNCVDDWNEDQADADGDDQGDICDICPDDPEDDADGDGLCGDVDLCDGSILPERVPTVSLGTNRWADTNGDGVFDTVLPKGKGPGRSYTLLDTDGCTCEQIIETCGYGDGHTKYGCSISVMDAWVAGNACH